MDVALVAAKPNNVRKHWSKWVKFHLWSRVCVWITQVVSSTMIIKLLCPATVQCNLFSSHTLLKGDRNENTSKVV